MWDDYRRANLDPDGKPPTQAALIEGTGLSQSAVSQYLNGYLKFGYGAVLKFANFFRVPPTDIRDDLDALPGAPGETDWRDIQGYAQAVGLGDGVEAQEYAETHKLKFRADSLARKRLSARSLAVMYGDGDSMEPRIRSGDAILFDTSDTNPRDEVLFVVQTHGVAGNACSVKRCRHFGDDVYFDALNPTGDHLWRKPRKMDDPHHPITIIGRVRWIGSWEN